MPFSFAKRFWSSRFNRSDRRPRRAGVALSLEPLEERWLPNATVITVTTAADDPTTPIAGQTTLRDAINQANQTTGATIQFAPSINGQTIQPLAALPAITGAGTTIDGLYSSIFLDGSNATPIFPGPIEPDLPGDLIIGFTDGLDVAASNVTIEGLSIVGWSGYGIIVGTGSNSVSNTIISGNSFNRNGAGGIEVLASNTNIVGNLITGNPGDGVEIIGNQNTVQGNTITFNSMNGVEVYAGSQDTIRNNYITGNDNLGILLDGIAGGTANNSITAPALTSVVYGWEDGLPTVTIEGNLNLPTDAPNGIYTLEFFANTSNTNPQGEISLGTITVTASGGATTPFTFTTALGAVPTCSFTATVTDPNGDTSEFSNALTATPVVLSPSPPASAPTAPAIPLPSSVQAAIALYIDGAELLFDQLAAYGNPNLAGVNAGIALNSPYAGPFAELFVLAGEAAMAEQLSATK